MRIDVHAHCWPAAYLDLIASYGSPRTEVARAMAAGDAPEDLARRLAELDRAAIDLQLISVLTQVPYFVKLDRALTAARLANDALAKVVAAHPDRLAALAVLPLPHVAESVEETARALDELGMAGIAVTSTVLGRSLADPEFAPLFAELDARGAVLLVHPSGAGCGAQVDEFGLAWAVGAPFEDTVAALHLVLWGVVERYPHVRIVLCHLGGALPMLARRIDSMLGHDSPENRHPRPSRLLGRLWYDSVDHGHWPALRCAVDTFGADRIVLGTDYPYLSGDELFRNVTHVEEAGLLASDVTAILDRNAAILLDGHLSGRT